MKGLEHRGYTLVEALVALVIFAAVGTLAVEAYAELARATRRLARASDELWAMRATRGVLGDELSRGARGFDWTVHPPDSLRVRAFRGSGLVCGVASDTTLVVRRLGSRRPDPAKDSVLVLGTGGVWSVSALLAVASGTCADSVAIVASGGRAVTERWRLDRPAEDAVLLRFFERGSYHLASRALRYRRGRGGRQPLTAEVLEGAFFVDAPFGLHAVASVADRPLDVRVGPAR